jgi:hypothetical protein
MRKLLTLTFIILGCAAFWIRPASAFGFSAPKPQFAYTDASGKKQSVDVVDKYYPKKIVHPFVGIRRLIQNCPRCDQAEERGAHSFRVLAFVGKRSLLRA